MDRLNKGVAEQLRCKPEFAQPTEELRNLTFRRLQRYRQRGKKLYASVLHLKKNKITIQEVELGELDTGADVGFDSFKKLETPIVDR